jgi:hypothetical protein
MESLFVIPYLVKRCSFFVVPYSVFVVLSRFRVMFSRLL